MKNVVRSFLRLGLGLVSRLDKLLPTWLGSVFAGLANRTRLSICNFCVGATFVGLSMLALSGVVGAAEDVTGFRGFAWGTDFEVVNREKELTWYQNVGDTGEHLSLLDTVTDEAGGVEIGYSYRFYQNKLVVGEVTFAKRTDYLDGVRIFNEKYGNPKFRKGSVSSYLFKSTVIFCDDEDESIQFWSREYMDGRADREQKAKQEKKEQERRKKDQEYDKIFN